MQWSHYVIWIGSYYEWIHAQLSFLYLIFRLPWSITRWVNNRSMTWWKRMLCYRGYTHKLFRTTLCLQPKSISSKPKPPQVCSWNQNGMAQQIAGLSFAQIAEKLEKDEVFVAAGFYGQVCGLFQNNMLAVFSCCTGKIFWARSAKVIRKPWCGPRPAESRNWPALVSSAFVRAHTAYWPCHISASWGKHLKPLLMRLHQHLGQGVLVYGQPIKVSLAYDYGGSQKCWTHSKAIINEKVSLTFI